MSEEDGDYGYGSGSVGGSKEGVTRSEPIVPEQDISDKDFEGRLATISRVLSDGMGLDELPPGIAITAIVPDSSDETEWELDFLRPTKNDPVKLLKIKGGRYQTTYIAEYELRSAGEFKFTDFHGNTPGLPHNTLYRYPSSQADSTSKRKALEHVEQRVDSLAIAIANLWNAQPRPEPDLVS